MDAVRWARWLFGSNAAINLAISVRGLVDPRGYAASFGVEAGELAWLVRLWMGLVLMFGALFLLVALDPRRNAALAKVNWAEKTVTATCVTLGFAQGEVPGSLMLLVVATNWLWIPFLLWNDVALRRAVRSPQA
ncbi:MAG: hypothetical protein QOC71_412 [Thermoplasmata archaeon]|jgi:hypothetical protein|nr:hypothetical protein [Thermoplasmata archaeon]